MGDLLPLPSLMWLYNIPFYEYSCLFVHSAAERHLGCFWFLAAINTGAVNILEGDLRSPAAHVRPFLLGIPPGMELQVGRRYWCFKLQMW